MNLEQTVVVPQNMAPVLLVYSKRFQEIPDAYPDTSHKTRCLQMFLSSVSLQRMLVFGLASLVTGLVL